MGNNYCKVIFSEFSQDINPLLLLMSPVFCAVFKPTLSAAAAAAAADEKSVRVLEMHRSEASRQLGIKAAIFHHFTLVPTLMQSTTD